MPDSKLISFNIIIDGSSRNIETPRNSYRNLMVLIKDMFYPDGFGECGGMGRCGTCMVRVHQTISATERNESATLAKMNITDDQIRLSCQLLINDTLEDAIIELLEVQ